MVIKHTKLIDKPVSRAKSEQCAELLVEYMKNNLGGEWKSRVWENLGWCWCVELGSIGLYYHNYEDNDGTWNFCAMISGETNKRGGALASWFSNDDRSKDPVEAVIKAMKRAQDYINKLQDSLDDTRIRIRKQ